MTDLASTNGPLLQRRLGVQLMEARKSAKVTQDAVSKLLRCSRANVSLIERGQQGVTDKQLTTMLNAYGVVDDHRKRIFELREQVRSAPKAWWDEYEDMFAPQAFRFWAYEDAASVIRAFTGTAVPGIFQTQRYATALADFYYADESAVYRRRFVESRLKRIAIVERGTCHMTYVVQESCLRAEVGGRDVLKEQLRQLVEVGENPMVSLRIIDNRHAMTALAGSSFTLLDFDGDDPSVHFANTPRGGVLNEGGRITEEERRRYTAIELSALSEEESMTLLKELAR